MIFRRTIFLLILANAAFQGSKPRKGYLLKDNTVTGLRELKNFVEVSFNNNKNQLSSGYILKKNLVKIK